MDSEEFENVDINDLTEDQEDQYVERYMIERERRETKKKEEDELAQTKLQEYRYKILSNPMFKGAS